MPQRIVCLSAESVELLFELGCADRIIGVSAFATHPPAARRKPRISGFSSFNLNRIDALNPDLVITFSDVQADAARELMRRGHTVLATNQRSCEETFNTMLLIGRIVGREAGAKRIVNRMRRLLCDRHAGAPARRPLVYFEEWNDPLISGIRWVSELIEAAGGRDIFPELRQCPRAGDRVVESREVIRRQPDVIIASWCGRKANLRAICNRPGWETIPAVRHGRVFEIDSADILQPGPGLLRGHRELRRILARIHGSITAR